MGIVKLSHRVGILFISIFILLGALEAQAKSKTPQVPSFQEIADLGSKERELYLKHFAGLTRKGEYRFLLKFLLVKQGKRRVCLPHIFGPKAFPKAKGKKGTYQCPINTKKAASLFDDSKNAAGWMKLRAQIRIHCLKQDYCTRFFHEQGRFYTKLEKGKKPLVKKASRTKRAKKPKAKGKKR